VSRFSAEIALDLSLAQTSDVTYSSAAIALGLAILLHVTRSLAALAVWLRAIRLSVASCPAFLAYVGLEGFAHFFQVSGFPAERALHVFLAVFFDVAGL
jgi:hypothetical protein